MKKRLSAVLAAVLCVCCALSTAVSVSAAGCGKRTGLTGWIDLRDPRFIWRHGEKTTDSVSFDSELLENAIREYYGVPADDALTKAQVDDIRKIDIYLSKCNDGLQKLDGYAGKFALHVVVNDGALPDGNGGLSDSVGEGIYETFGGSRGVLGYDPLPIVTHAQSLKDVISKITDDYSFNKFNSFYIIKSTAGLDDEGIEELGELFPACVEADASLAVIDPMTKEREFTALLDIAVEFGFINEDAIVDSLDIEFSESDMEKLSCPININIEND